MSALNDPNDPDVSEPRMVKMARRIGMRAGCIVDLTELDEDGHPHDLSKESVRQRVKAMISMQTPFMLVMGPPRATCPASQAFNGIFTDRSAERAELEKGIQHVKVIVELCLLQNQAGRRFTMEDSTSATSWSLECLQALVKSEGVIKVDFDSCLLGLKVRNDVGEALVRTRIGMLTNSVPVAEALRKMPYQGCHRQVQLMSG